MVKGLRGVRFQWAPAQGRELGKTLKLPKSQTQIGFIAQEVEKVVPEAVVPPSKDGSDLYGLKESDLIPVLVQAVKEQQVEIEELRSQVAALKSAH